MEWSLKSARPLAKGYKRFYHPSKNGSTLAARSPGLYMRIHHPKPAIKGLNPSPFQNASSHILLADVAKVLFHARPENKSLRYIQKKIRRSLAQNTSSLPQNEIHLDFLS